MKQLVVVGMVFLALVGCTRSESDVTPQSRSVEAESCIERVNDANIATIKGWVDSGYSAEFMGIARYEASQIFTPEEMSVYIESIAIAVQAYAETGTVYSGEEDAGNVIFDGCELVYP